MNQPPENWILVFRSTAEHEVDIVKARLADHNITGEVISSHDHMIDAINMSKEVGLYVHKNDFELASKIIQEAGIE